MTIEGKEFMPTKTPIKEEETQPKGELRWVQLSEIKVDPTKNPRGPISEDDIAELVDNIRANGVLEPVICVEGEDGLELVAGYRRVLAAAKAKVTDIPVHIRGEETREEDAINENLPGVRQDVKDIAEARALKQLAKTKGLSQKALAKRTGKSRSFIAERFRMLRLPEAVQEVFVRTDLGISTVQSLLKIAKASEAAAVATAELVAGDSDAERQLRKHPTRAIDQLARALSKERGTMQDGEGRARTRPPAEGELVVIRVSGGYMGGVEVDDLALSEERRDELLQRVSAVAESDRRFNVYSNELSVRLDDDDADALRAMGVLLELDEQDHMQPTRYCFESDAVVGRVEAILERAEADAKEREEAEAKAILADAEASGKEVADKTPAELRAEEEKEKRANELAKAKKEKKKARRLNLDLGLRLLKRRGRKRSEKRRRELVRGLALLAVRAEEDLAGLGPRLVYETWQTVENKTLKSGKPSEKVTHLTPQEATERLLKNIEEAKTVDDILDLIGDALVAAVYSSEVELPMSRRLSNYGRRLRFGSAGAVRRAIDGEAAGVLPPALEAELKRSQKHGYDSKTPLTYRIR